MIITRIETFANEFVGFVRITDDTGAQGWGQVSTYHSDITAQVVHRQVAPYALGMDTGDINAITDFVRRGGRLGMVCDLYDRKGIPVPFFGKPAKTQAIGAMIARRLGTRIWLSRCVRVGRQSRFRIEIVELKVPRTANRSADITWIMTEMQKQFEAWIIEYPEQWMWSNRRWS